MTFAFKPDTVEFFPYAAIAEVEEAITPQQRGRVKFMGTTWFARFYGTDASILAVAGTPVKVIGREGLTLLVVSVNDMVRVTGFRENSSDLLKRVQKIMAWFSNALS